MTRTFQKKIEADWIDTKMDDIAKYDVFRVLDDGEVVVDGLGNTEFRAVSDPYHNEDGTLTINVDA